MIIRVVIDILFAIGIFFIFAGVVGMIRMPDTLCRLEAAKNISTMGILPILLGASIYGFSTGSAGIGIKAIIVVIIIVLGSPICSHAMSKTAYKTKAFGEGIKYDYYGRDNKNE